MINEKELLNKIYNHRREHENFLIDCQLTETEYGRGFLDGLGAVENWVVTQQTVEEKMISILERRIEIAEMNSEEGVATGLKLALSTFKTMGWIK